MVDILDFEFKNTPLQAPEDITFSAAMVQRLELPEEIVDERHLGEYLGEEVVFSIDLTYDDEFRRGILNHLRSQVKAERQPLFEGIEWGLGLIPATEGANNV